MELRIKDVAKLLKVSEKTIYRWVKEESIPFYQINHQYRFDRTELNEWIKKTSRRPGEETGDSEPDHAPIRLRGLLERGGVYYKVEGCTPDEIFRNSLHLINLPQPVRFDQAFEALMDRETLMTTAMGDGIAFPHPRVPIPSFRGDELVALCFLENPVNLGALDGVNVHSLFFIFTSDTARHLEVITKLSFLCKKSGFQELLKKQAVRSDIYAAIENADEHWRNGTV